MSTPSVQRRRARRVRKKNHVSDTLRLFAQTRERLTKLADEPRMALSLVMVEGLSYEEAAVQLEISVSELFSRLGQARDALHVMLSA